MFIFLLNLVDITAHVDMVLGDITLTNNEPLGLVDVVDLLRNVTWEIQYLDGFPSIILKPVCFHCKVVTCVRSNEHVLIEIEYVQKLINSIISEELHHIIVLTEVIEVMRIIAPEVMAEKRSDEKSIDLLASKDLHAKTGVFAVSLIIDNEVEETIVLTSIQADCVTIVDVFVLTVVLIIHRLTASTEIHIAVVLLGGFWRVLAGFGGLLP